MSLRNIISRSPIHQGSFRSIQLQSAVPEKIHTHPMKGHWKFLGGGGVRSQILEAKYEARLEFPGGKGVQNKQPSMGGGGSYRLWPLITALPDVLNSTSFLGSGKSYSLST